MTFDQWFAARGDLGRDDALRIYGEITGDDGAGLYIRAIKFPAGYLLVSTDGQYHAICGRDDLLTHDLRAAAWFLWENHSRFEVPYLSKGQ